MPAKTKKVRRAAAIAEHEPEKLYKRNRGMLKMSKNQLSDFARTKEKGLPVSKKKKKRPRAESISSFMKRRNSPRA